MSNSHYNSKRKRSVPVSNSFSGELYKTGQYFSDYDLILTDNSTYHQYTFSDGENYLGKPKIKRIIEVKYDATDYVKRQVKNKELPNAQTLAFASMVSEVNRVRVSDKIQLWFVIQTENDYPYRIFEFDCEINEFKFLKTVETLVEFTDLLES